MISTQKKTASSTIFVVKFIIVIICILLIVLNAVLLFTNGFRYYHFSGRYLTVEMKTPVSGAGKLYFDTGSNYRETETYRFDIKATSRFEKYVIPLPESTIKSIRFDPLDNRGPFEIKSLTIETRDDKYLWEGEKLARQIAPLQQINVVNINPIFIGFSTGIDPNFHVEGFTVPANRHNRSRVLLSMVIFTAGIALMGFMVFLIADALIRSDHLYPREKSSISLFLQNIAAGILVLAIIGLYLWTATSNYKPFHFIIDGAYDNLAVYYADLAEALLQGRLSLLIEPSQELISLPDPYDPLQNSDLRLHDASLYKGNYYLYFGPAPALMAFIPWKLLTGQRMPHNLAAAIFAVSGFVVSILLMILIIRGAELKGSFLTVLIGIVMLGICNMVLPVLRKPLMYEVSVLSAYCWSMLSLFFIFSFLLFDNRKIIYLVVSSLCYGLAIASRFSYLFGVVIFLIPLWSFLNPQKVYSRSFFKKMAVFLSTVGLPLTLCIGILLLYNYMRFENFLESGLKYQLGIVRPLDHPFISIKNFWINNYLNLMSGVFINGSFPFFHVQSVNIPVNIIIPSYYPIYCVKDDPPAAGLLMNIPFLWIIIPGWIYLKLRKLEFSKLICRFTSLLLLGGTANWLVVSFFSFANIRYVIDFLPIFVLLACLIYFMIYDHLHKVIVGRAIVQCIAIITVVYAALTNIGFSIEVKCGGQTFQKWNPELYTAIENFFDFIPQIINKMY